MNEKQQRLLIISGFIVLSLIVIGVITLIFNTTQSQTSTDLEQNEFVDPATGETLLSPEGKSPEVYGVNPNEPIFVGFSNLYQFGVRQPVVDNIKSFLNDYANQRIVDNEERIEEISIVVDTIRHTINSEANTNDYTFDIIVNRKADYSMVVTMRGVISMTASLMNTSDEPILKKTYDL